MVTLPGCTTPDRLAKEPDITNTAVGLRAYSGGRVTGLATMDRNHCIDLRAGRLSGLTAASDVSGLFQNLRNDPRRDTLVLHFHGGLNSRDDGVLRSAGMLPFFHEAGAYPVFFAWESAFGEVIENQLAALMAEPLFQPLLQRVLAFAQEKIRGAAVRGVDAHSPVRDAVLAAIDGGADPDLALAADQRARLFSLKAADQRNFEIALTNDVALREHLAGLGDPGAIGTSTSSIANLLRRPGPDGKPTRFDPLSVVVSLAVRVLARLFKRYATGRDHGMRATVVEELAQALMVGKFFTGPFALMKSQIDQAFGADERLRGGTAFLAGMRGLWDTGWRPRIVLVGHSAGSIYICGFIDRARELLPDARFDVVFMTPGVSFQRLAMTIAGGRGAIHRFRSYSLDEQAEERDPLSDSEPVKAVFPRSTLYFASGVLEYDGGPDAGDMPLVGMQRYFKRADIYTSTDVQTVRDYVAERSDRQVWIKPDGEFGRVGHAGIENNPLMREHLRRIIVRGFDAD